MITKTQIITDHILNERWAEAFSMASKFQRLGKHRDAILRAQSARNNPSFYEQMGKDLNMIEAQGKASLVMMFVCEKGN